MEFIYKKEIEDKSYDGNSLQWKKSTMEIVYSGKNLQVKYCCKSTRKSFDLLFFTFAYAFSSFPSSCVYDQLHEFKHDSKVELYAQQDEKRVRRNTFIIIVFIIIFLPFFDQFEFQVLFCLFLSRL